MAHDIDCYHSNSLMTLLAIITASSSQNSKLSLFSPPPWLVEIHSKLWGKHDLFGQVFRTTNLTKADFIELQHQLQELNPERNSESYVATNVLATKSAFLRSRSTALFGTNLDNGPVPRLVFNTSQPPSSDVMDDDADDADAVADNAMDIDPNHGSSGHTTVEPLITHTPRWTAQGMGYEGLWVSRGMLKIDLKIYGKIVENRREKKVGLHTIPLIVTERHQLNSSWSLCGGAA
jgi:hypothetical protein